MRCEHNPVNHKAKEFEVTAMPLLLEGPVRHMKTLSTHSERLSVYDKVHKSPLFDKELKQDCGATDY